MKNPIAILSFSILLFLISNCSKPPTEHSSIAEESKGPAEEWFYNQRAYPHGKIDQSIYREAVKERLALEKIESRNNSTWEFEGPTNIGGRITDVEMHPSSMDIIYAGTASGGIFKSKDRGASWEPIFDDELTLSIGDMAITPSDPEILYVGTGESNGGGGSLAYEGVGMYKSIDEGESWEHVGLDSIGTVGKVLVHPEDPDKVWVAAMGALYENSTSRGIYRSINGGEDWEQVLYVSDSTGAIDLVMHPEEPDIIYAAMWERLRRPQYRQYGGATCGIYRSNDGGETWLELTNDLPSDDNGRIGLAVDPSYLGRVYAMYTDEIGYHKDIFRSDDYGESWSTINSDSLSTYNVSYGWWFGRLYIHPEDPETIFAFNLFTYRTKNSGAKWDNVNYNDSVDVHVDPHSLYIHPQNPNYIVLGNDGGVYISEDGGDTWDHKNNLPITQFYTCEIDPFNPQRLYGGTQDNGTIRTLTGAEDDWQRILGGDGMFVKIDPVNGNTIYAETQYGILYKSIDEGNNFSFSLQNLPNWWLDRRNWRTPYLIPSNDPQSLYYCTQRIHRSLNGTSSWTTISPDLTGNPVQQTNQFFYGTITSISVSPTNSNIIYVGTDNGRVWNTTEGGGINNWNLLSENLPNRWVTAVAAHPTESQIAYVTFSGYREADYLPHVFKTLDSGSSWIDISSNLPEVPVNDIIIDSETPDVLYLATDVGVYYTLSDGENWELLGLGLPNVVVTDLCLDQENKKLIAATFGRSMFSISLDDLILDADEPRLISDFKIFPNPIVDIAKINFQIEKDDLVEILLFDINGQLVKRIFRGHLSVGTHEVEVNLLPFPAGTYICQLKNKSGHRSRLIIKR